MCASARPPVFFWSEFRSFIPKNNLTKTLKWNSHPHTNYLFYQCLNIASVIMEQRERERESESIELVGTRNRLQLMASLNLIYVRNMFIMCLKINISLCQRARFVLLDSPPTVPNWMATPNRVRSLGKPFAFFHLYSIDVALFAQPLSSIPWSCQYT